MDREVSQTYLVQQIMTASPAKLVAMLYERAITLLHETVDAIEAGDIERRWRANGKATDVICHLWGTLDREHGGEIAEGECANGESKGSSSDPPSPQVSLSA